MVPVELRRLLIDQRRDEHAVFLQEVGGTRGLPIVIGIFEATVLDRILKNRPAPRPLTHDLIGAVIAALNASLSRVEIDGFDGDCYFAKLCLTCDEQEHRIDCRPSDALALALQHNVPILLDPEFLHDPGPAL